MLVLLHTSLTKERSYLSNNPSSTAVPEPSFFRTPKLSLYSHIAQPQPRRSAAVRTVLVRAGSIAEAIADHLGKVADEAMGLSGKARAHGLIVASILIDWKEAIDKKFSANQQ